LCINDFYGKQIRNIPRHGVLLWHEGILPEYKGLYSAFWTLYNRDYTNLGYSLIRINNKIDDGEILIQQIAKNVDISKHDFIFIGHKAIYDGLPDVKALLGHLLTKEITPIQVVNRKSNYYSYPTIIDYLKMRKRLNNYLKYTASIYK